MAAVDYFLKLDDVDGESEDSVHKGEIDVESFSFGVSNQGSHSGGGGGGAGKAVFQDFHFVQKVHKGSPILLLNCAVGKHIPKAVLTCRKAGGEQIEFLVVTMSDLLVSSFQTGGSGGSDIVPMEQISLNYAKIEFAYHAQKKDGTAAAPVKSGYDIKLNKKV